MSINLSDTELIDALKKDDMNAFEILYNRYQKAVHANIRKLIKKEDIALDILQTVFMKFWEQRNKLHGDQPLAGWLFVVSYNQSISYIKKISKEKKALADIILHYQHEANLPDHNFEVQLTVINNAINQLSPRKKSVFYLCRLEGKTYEEAAQQLGISKDTVKEYLQASLKTIKQHLAEQHLTQSGSVLSVGLLCYLSL